MDTGEPDSQGRDGTGMQMAGGWLGDDFLGGGKPVTPRPSNAGPFASLASRMKENTWPVLGWGLS